MKKFLLSDRTQGIINVTFGVWLIVALIIMFSVPSTSFDKSIWYPVSAGASIIGFLWYNVWVSLALNPSTKP